MKKVNKKIITRIYKEYRLVHLIYLNRYIYQIKVIIKIKKINRNQQINKNKILKIAIEI